MTDRYLFTDTATATLEYSGTDELTVDADFDAAQAETVTLDTKWEQFFGTDEYVQFDATVAQPIVQLYFHDGELRRFKKDEQELKRAQAQLENIAGTVTHPQNDRVTHTDQIRGFWSGPEYDSGQDLTLNVPANDSEAVRAAVQKGDVSVGFSGVLDWTDDDTTEYDAVQRNITYDHVAFGLETGRCSNEDGCGLHTDSTELHGHVIDAVQTQLNEEDLTEYQWDGDEWVYTPDGYGQVISSDTPDDTVLVRTFDTDSMELTDTQKTYDASELRRWVGPHADSCPGDTCSCGCHVADDSAQNTEQSNYTDTMNLTEFIDENDLTIEDVIDSLDVDVAELVDTPDEPSDFYDGQPSVEDLADDFDAVDLLVDEKNSLAQENEELTESLRESQRPVFADKAENLAELTEKWGDKEALLDKFDADDADERWTVEMVDDKLELVEDIKSTETTTVGDSGGSTSDNEPEIPTTDSGRFDLREQTAGGN